jgi:hypothetical protein
MGADKPPQEYPVRLTNMTAGEAQGVFVLRSDEQGDDCILTLQFQHGEITARALDFFEAMCQIRRQLEAIGWRPVCYGSSLNVYPSGMARDMGRGLKAYRMEHGRRVDLADLVSIFDTGPDVNPCSVEEQRAFWENWLRSINPQS